MVLEMEPAPDEEKEEAVEGTEDENEEEDPGEGTEGEDQENEDPPFDPSVEDVPLEEDPKFRAEVAKAYIRGRKDAEAQKPQAKTVHHVRGTAKPLPSKDPLTAEERKRALIVLAVIAGVVVVAAVIIVVILTRSKKDGENPAGKQPAQLEEV